MCNETAATVCTIVRALLKLRPATLSRNKACPREAKLRLSYCLRASNGARGPLHGIRITSYGTLQSLSLSLTHTERAIVEKVRHLPDLFRRPC